MKKKSTKKVVERFRQSIEELQGFSEEVHAAGLSKRSLSICYEMKIIKLYKDFERLMLSCIVAAINNNTDHLSKTKGFEFPKHLTDEVCEYIVTGDGYFDFRGKSGLIKTLKNYLPDTHYLIVTIKDKRYTTSLDMLSALRNYAAHDSPQSKKKALDVTRQTKMGSAGSYLKANGGQRFGEILLELDHLAGRISAKAPY